MSCACFLRDPILHTPNALIITRVKFSKCNKFKRRASATSDKPSQFPRVQVRIVFRLLIVVLLVLVNIILKANLSFKILSSALLAENVNNASSSSFLTSVPLQHSNKQKKTLLDMQLTRTCPRNNFSHHHPDGRKETADLSMTKTKTKTTTVDISWISTVPNFLVCRFNNSYLHRDGTVLIMKPPPSAL